ncbi:MAG: Wzy polymerase domain-containing protein [Rhodocyclales bacterium]|nr:Wzy polymerase domain-containing protein [Rhodocyclales bacterium]
MRAESIFRSAPRLATGFGLLALMASGPFLWPFHTPPIGSFWNEWWAGALGLAAAAVLLADRKRDVPLPALLGIPAVLLLALLLQFALGRLVFPQIGLLYAAYLLWAGLLLILGRHLADSVGLARLVDVLAWAFALGALAGAAIALAQWTGIAAGVWWIYSYQGSGVYANLGQANHHAQYSWLGIASLFYLRGRGWLSRPLLWLALLPIVLGSVLGGSRSVLVYPVILLAAIVWARRREPEGAVARLLVDAALLLPAVVVLSFLGFWASPAGPGAGVTSVTRLYQTIEGPSMRLALARTAWTVFIEQPWLGQGAGNYPWASFVAAAGQTSEAPLWAAENAHNFILQGLAEFGAPVTAAVILLLLFWAKRFAARPWGLEQFWCGAVLGIGAMYALFEYPLWYAYFLGPTALLLGATDSGGAILLSGRRAAIYMVPMALAGLSILTSLRVDYSVIEAAAIQELAAGPDRERNWQASMESLKVLHRESLLSPWVLLAFAGPAEPSRQQVPLRVTLCERVIRFEPARSLLARCAMQLAIAGRDADAQKLVRSVLGAFPAERAATADELAKGAREYPELVPLWHLSLGK